jgi:hypothetical protein
MLGIGNKKMSRLTAAKLGLGLLAYCAVVFAQQTSSTAVLLSRLKSPNEQLRSDAYEEIKMDQNALKRSDVKAALIDLLDRENQVIHKRLADSNGEAGVSVKFGEGFGEYIGELLDTVAEIADWHDQHQLCILAESAYSPDSQFAARLAVEGGTRVAPCLLKMAHGSIVDRHESIPVLVQLSAVTKGLSPAIREQIRQAIIAGLRDSTVLVRQPTVQAVGKYGTAEMIPRLQEIARSDPNSRLLDNGQRRFDIRDAAATAIQSIHERAKAQ